MRENDQYVIVSKPQHIFFYPNLLQNKYVVSTEVRIALNKSGGPVKFRKINVDELNRQMNLFKNNFLRPCYSIDEDIFYKSTGTLTVGHIGLSEFSSRDFIVKLFSEGIENRISEFRQQLLEKKTTDHEAENKIYDLTCKLNQDLISLRKSDLNKFYRMVWIYFYPNYSSALGPKYFLTKTFLEKIIFKKGFYSEHVRPLFNKITSQKMILNSEEIQSQELHIAKMWLMHNFGYQMITTDGAKINAEGEVKKVLAEKGIDVEKFLLNYKTHVSNELAF